MRGVEKWWQLAGNMAASAAASLFLLLLHLLLTSISNFQQQYDCTNTAIDFEGDPCPKSQTLRITIHMCHY